MPITGCDPLISALLEAEQLAAKLGRWRTYHKINDAKKEAGYELADIRTGKQHSGAEHAYETVE